MTAAPAVAPPNRLRTWFFRVAALLGLGLVAAAAVAFLELRRVRDVELERALALVTQGEAAVEFMPPGSNTWYGYLSRSADFDTRTMAGPKKYLELSDRDWRSAFERIWQVVMWDEVHDPAAVRRLADCPALAILRVRRCRIDQEDLDAIAACTPPSILDLSESDLSGLDLSPLQNQPNMKTLWLHGASLDDRRIAFLSGCNTLESLYLDQNEVAGAFLAGRNSWPKLKMLGVSRTKFDAAGLALLAARCPNLTYFRAAGCIEIDDSAVALGNLASLERVNLNHTQAGDAVAEALARLPNLRILCMAGTPLTANGLYALMAAPALRELHIYETDISDEDVNLFLEQRRVVWIMRPGEEGKEDY